MEGKDFMSVCKVIFDNFQWSSKIRTLIAEALEEGKWSVLITT
jgi:hypothetical protein